MDQHKRIIAIDLRSRGFGFAVFEGPTRLLDWGVKSFRHGVYVVKLPANEKLSLLLDQYLPSAVVLSKQFPKSEKARMREALSDEPEKRRIPVRFITRRAVKNAFSDSNRNKYTIAAALANQFPELVAQLPGVRKIWKSEDYRMSILMRLQ